VIKDKPVPGYRQEPDVNPESRTETFVAAKFYIDNFRWAGVPFYIRTGKRLPQKTVEIVIQFKEMPYLFFNREGNLAPNLLRIRISPVEGMQLLLNANQPSQNHTITPIAMEYCNNCDEESREAYERLIQDAVEGDSTYFTRWDEVALAWKKVDPIQHAWANDNSPLPKYPAGSWGPEEQSKLFEHTGHEWWPVGGQEEVQVVQAVEQPHAGVRR
jgi:glucose-6-phosphate 1-dehydrogenase